MLVLTFTCTYMVLSVIANTPFCSMGGKGGEGFDDHKMLY